MAGPASETIGFRIRDATRDGRLTALADVVNTVRNDVDAIGARLADRGPTWVTKKRFCGMTKGGGTLIGFPLQVVQASIDGQVVNGRMERRPKAPGSNRQDSIPTSKPSSVRRKAGGVGGR